MSQPRLFTLEGAYNIRELGGYPTESGLFTRRNRFLRADGPHNLSEADIRLLREHGLTLAIDLRAESERKNKPSKLMDVEGVRSEQIDLLAELDYDIFSGYVPPSMSDLYISLLDQAGKALARVFRLFAVNIEHTSLFHCTAGKDRTGVTAMLLLHLAGVDDEIIIADYAESERNLEPVFQAQGRQIREQGRMVPGHLFESKPEQMERSLRHLEDKYGCAARYLQEIGLSMAEIERIRQGFLTEAAE